MTELSTGGIDPANLQLGSRDGLRPVRRRYESTVRFHVLLNVGLAVSGSLLLKLDGPWYAEGIVAGIYLVGFLLSVYSLRTVKAAEAELETLIKAELEQQQPSTPVGMPPSPRLLFVLLAIFFVASAFAVVWFTFVVPSSGSFSDEAGLARNQRQGPTPRPVSSSRPATTC